MFLHSVTSETYMKRNIGRRNQERNKIKSLQIYTEFFEEKDTEIKRKNKHVRERSREGRIRKDIPGRIEIQEFKFSYYTP